MPYGKMQPNLEFLMPAQSLRSTISACLFADETALVKELAAEALLSADDVDHDGGT